MDEARRLAYLETLGVPLYYPRRALPGAAPARRLPHLLSRPQRAAAPLSLQTPSPQTPATPPAGPAAAAVTEPAAPVAPAGRVEAPAAPPRRRQAPAAPAAFASTTRPTAQVPRFHLACIRIGSLLVIDDPAPPRDEQARGQLLWHVALAIGALPRPQPGEELRPGPQAVRNDTFTWPLVRSGHPALDQSLEAARATLGHFVELRVQEGGLRQLLVFGERGADLLAELRCEGLSLYRLPFRASDMLRQPLLKAQLWAALNG